MKYSELHRMLRKAGCYLTGKQMAGRHPLWYSPKSGETFKTSNHDKQEVPTGTLRNILKSAGLL